MARWRGGRPVRHKQKKQSIYIKSIRVRLAERQEEMCRRFGQLQKIKKDSSYKKRKQREKNNGNGWTKEEWLFLVNWYGNKCLRCGSEDRIVADHVVPLVKGGAHSIDNIQPLCWSCNRWKNTRILDFRSETGGVGVKLQLIAILE